MVTLPYVSIVIPTRNRKRDLLECLSSIRQLNYPKEKLEIIVWDNHSDDGTSEAVEAFFGEIASERWLNLSLIRSETNVGPYIPYNRVLERLYKNCEYILGLDDDVLLNRECLLNLAEVTRMYSKVGVVGCRAVYHQFPDRTSSGAGFVNWWLGRLRYVDSDELIECDYVIGCCWLINKEAFVEVGGFDEDYFIMHWEIDFCAKVKKHNYGVYYQPAALVIHKTSPNKRSGLYYLFRNKILLIRKNTPLLPRITSLTLYISLWIPKLLIDSIKVNKGLNFREIKETLAGVLHGFLGKVGRHPKY